MGLEVKVTGHWYSCDREMHYCANTLVNKRVICFKQIEGARSGFFFSLYCLCVYWKTVFFRVREGNSSNVRRTRVKKSWKYRGVIFFFFYFFRWPKVWFWTFTYSLSTSVYYFYLSECVFFFFSLNFSQFQKLIVPIQLSHSADDEEQRKRGERI